MPQTMIVFVIGTLSLGRHSTLRWLCVEEEVLGAVLAGGFVVPFAMLLLAAFLTAFYMFRVIFLAFFGATPEHDVQALAPPVTTEHGGGAHAAASPGDGRRRASRARSAVHHGGATLDPGAAVDGRSACTSRSSIPRRVHVSCLADAGAVLVALAGITTSWLMYQRRAIDPERVAASAGADSTCRARALLDRRRVRGRL
jgi:NADH:ubiquinone oxidoreductase subunit 5 (subunit L)/multisubunit Na+/H+ antiporter MnhA subunit